MTARDPIIDQLATVRTRAGLTINALAHRLGWPPVVLGSYERGDRNPHLGRVRHWCQGLDHQLLALGTDHTNGQHTWLEHAVRYHRPDADDQHGYIECGSEDEAEAVAACMHAGRVVTRRVHATEWREQ